MTAETRGGGRRQRMEAARDGRRQHERVEADVAWEKRNWNSLGVPGSRGLRGLRGVWENNLKRLACQRFE